MSARVALSSRSSPSLLVAFLLYSLSFSAFAQFSNKRLSLGGTYAITMSVGSSLLRAPANGTSARNAAGVACASTGGIDSHAMISKFNFNFIHSVFLSFP